MISAEQDAMVRTTVCGFVAIDGRRFAWSGIACRSCGISYADCRAAFHDHCCTYCERSGHYAHDIRREEPVMPEPVQAVPFPTPQVPFGGDPGVADPASVVEFRRQIAAQSLESDPELQAMAQLLAALEPLDRPTRRRVLAWATNRYT